MRRASVRRRERIVADAWMRTDAAARTRLACADDARRLPANPARVAWAAARASLQHKAHRHAAALAYYTLFALGPVLFLALKAASLVVGDAGAQAIVLGRAQALLGPQLGRALDELLLTAAKSGPGTLGTALGLVALVLGATGAFAQLRDSLNAMWGLERREGHRAKEKAAELAHHHSLSFAAVVGTVLLVTLALLAGGVLGSALVGLPVSLVALTLVLSLTYRFLPDAEVAWRDAATGGLVAAALVVFVDAGMTLYVRSAPDGVIGVAGAVLLLLLWLYATELLVLYGAAFTRAHARDRGRDVAPDEHARPRGADGLTPARPRAEKP